MLCSKDKAVAEFTRKKMFSYDYVMVCDVFNSELQCLRIRDTLAQLQRDSRGIDIIFAQERDAGYDCGADNNYCILCDSDFQQNAMLDLKVRHVTATAAETCQVNMGVALLKAPIDPYSAILCARRDAHLRRLASRPLPSEDCFVAC